LFWAQLSAVMIQVKRLRLLPYLDHEHTWRVVKKGGEGAEIWVSWNL
jgi:hypothetical protein